MEQGILTTEQESKLAQLLDESLKLKGFILEIVDGYVFRAIITLVDNNVIDKLQEAIKVDLAALVEAVLAEDVELAEQLATDVVNGLIDIPALDEDTEGLLFKGVIEILVAAVLNWIEKKKEVPVTLKVKSVAAAKAVKSTNKKGKVERAVKPSAKRATELAAKKAAAEEAKLAKKEAVQAAKLAKQEDADRANDSNFNEDYNFNEEYVDSPSRHTFHEDDNFNPRFGAKPLDKPAYNEKYVADPSVKPVVAEKVVEEPSTKTVSTKKVSTEKEVKAAAIPTVIIKEWAFTPDKNVTFVDKLVEIKQKTLFKVMIVDASGNETEGKSWIASTGDRVAYKEMDGDATDKYEDASTKVSVRKNRWNVDPLTTPV